MSADNQIRLTRIEDPYFIPRALVDQLPQDIFNTDNFIEQFVPHATNFLYIITDRKDKDEPRKGFLWIQANPMIEILQIIALSLAPDFRESHPNFLHSTIMPRLRNMARKAKYKVSWTRRTTKSGQTKYGTLKEIRVYILEVDHGQ